MSEDTTKTTVQHTPNGETGVSPAVEGTLRNFAELEQHFERIKKLHAQTAQRESELEKAATEVQARSKALEARSAELDEWAKQVDQERTGVEGQRRELDAARKDVEDKLRALAEAQKNVDEGHAALERGKHEAAEATAKLDSLRKELEARGRSLDERDKTVSSAEEGVAARQKSLEEAQAKLDKELASAATDRQKLDAEQRDLAATQQRLATMMKAVQNRAGELEQREKALVTREKMAQKGAAAAKEIERADGEVKKLEAALAERSALVTSRDTEIARLKSEAERLAGEIAHAQAQVKAAQAAAVSHSAKPAADAKGRAEVEAELEKSRRAIEMLAEKLRAAQKETEELRKRPAAPARKADAVPQPSADGRIKTDPHNLLRRKRLQKYKAMLQTQARKIMSAQAALAKRQAEADQILAHRGKLAAAAEHIRNREAKLNAQRAKSAGAMIAFSFAATTAAMAAIGWFAAVQVAPATYLASATIEADAKGRQPSSTDLEGWQAYHRDLVADPQLMGQAAERIGRRGISELSNPAALQAFLKTALVVESSRDGQLILHMKGDSAQRTATLLDTYVTTLTATANMNRTQRPDGLVSEITQPVAVPEQPVTDERLTYAAGIFGGGMFLSFMLGGIGWQRVKRSRRRAEGDEAVEGFLDQKNWPKPQG